MMSNEHIIMTFKTHIKCEIFIIVVLIRQTMNKLKCDIIK